MNAVSGADSVGHSEMLALTGITYRQLNTWTNSGLVRKLSGGGRSGFCNYMRWPVEEIQTVWLMGVLTAAGLTPTAAARVVRGEPLAPGIRVVVSGGDDARVAR